MPQRSLHARALAPKHDRGLDEKSVDAYDKRPYRRPRLTVYGRLDRLTAFGGSEIVDSGTGLGAQP